MPFPITQIQMHDVNLCDMTKHHNKKLKVNHTTYISPPVTFLKE